MASPQSPVLPTRAGKRKAFSIAGQAHKRARRSRSPLHHESDSSEHSDEPSIVDNSDNELSFSALATPMSITPSRQSSKTPSRPRNHHCTYDGCTKTFTRPTHLADHIRSHTNTRAYVCPHAPCAKDFLRESHLKHHIKSAHTDVRDYVCSWEGCGKQFLTNQRLKKHNEAHEGREKYRCGVQDCGQTFRKHGTLQKHIISVHEGNSPFICDENGPDGQCCGRGFQTAYKLKSHRSLIHGGSRFWCTICNGEETHDGSVDERNSELAFPTYSAFVAHNKTVHPPTCNNCGAKFGTLKELTRHIEFQHEKELVDRRTHLCLEPNCGRAFVTKGNLTAHVKAMHAQEKPFTCSPAALKTLSHISTWSGANACGLAFARKASLETHIRTVHMGLRNPPRYGQHASNTPPGRASKKETVSMLSRLTGTAYAEDPARTIACTQHGCLFRFTRNYDLEMHLQSRHGLADAEVQLLLTKQDGQAQTRHGFRLTGVVGEVASMDIDMDQLGVQFVAADRPGGVEIGHARDDDWGAELDAAVATGGQFWIGGGEDRWDGMDAGDDGMNEGEECRPLWNDWDAEETDMQRLIGEELSADEAQNAMAIDPALI